MSTRRDPSLTELLAQRKQARAQSATGDPPSAWKDLGHRVLQTAVGDVSEEFEREYADDPCPASLAIQLLLREHEENEEQQNKRCMQRESTMLRRGDTDEAQPHLSRSDTAFRLATHEPRQVASFEVAAESGGGALRTILTRKQSSRNVLSEKGAGLSSCIVFLAVLCCVLHVACLLFLALWLMRAAHCAPHAAFCIVHAPRCTLLDVMSAYTVLFACCMLHPRFIVLHVASPVYNAACCILSL